MSPTSPSTGFGTTITNLAPGDAVNRYIDLTNSGTCADVGGAVTLVGAAPLSTFATPQAFSSASLAAAAGLHLQIQTALPDQAETTTNGTLPANTVQNGSVSLTYTFNELQRTATTNS